MVISPVMNLSDGSNFLKENIGNIFYLAYIYDLFLHLDIRYTYGLRVQVYVHY